MITLLIDNFFFKNYIWSYIYNSFYNGFFLIIIIISYFTFICFISKNILKILNKCVFLLIFSSLLLFFYQLELFAILLILTEFIVFFFLFILILSKKVSNLNKISLVFLNLFFIFIFFPQNYISFYDFGYVNWYEILFEVSNDVTNLFIFFYLQNYIILLLIGVYLYMLTLVLVYVGLFFFNYFFFKKNRSKKGINFFLKQQVKSKHILKKPLFFFKNNSKNDF